MRLVFIYGPPAVGKLTVGQELAALTGFKLFHNHLTVNAVSAVFPRGSEPFDRLLREFRAMLLAEAARQGVDLIMTWAHGPSDHVARAYADVVESNGGQVHLVRLLCDREALLARVSSPSRREAGKLTSATELESLMDERYLMRPLPFGDSLAIDTTDLPPAEAARRIAAHYALPAG
jgi:shikimate kinase